MNNFHTHTWRCKHATGTVRDYAEAAVKSNRKKKDKGETGDIDKTPLLGISDHTPLPDNRWPHVRMDMSELDAYTAEFNEAEPDDIVLLRGLECEWDPVYRNFYEDELLGERGFDYLIGSVHWFRNHGEWDYLSEIKSARQLFQYAEIMVATMETGLFSFIAHPDGFGAGYKKWDKNAEACSRDILSAAEELNIPLEINGYGLRKESLSTPEGLRNVYPWLKFWELAENYNIKAICNSDAHHPEDVHASIDECREIAKTYSIDLVDDISRKNRPG